MADSMIPYSFTPGTKAKAGEVNANFAALATIIGKLKNDTTTNLSDLNELINTKPDTEDLVTNHTITKTGEDLNNYKTPGTYVFKSGFTPTNIPSGSYGLLIVKGDKNSIIKQIWLRADSTNQIFTRNFSNNKWSAWTSIYCALKLSNPGYIKFDNGLLVQWGHCIQNKQVTYPIAYTTIACPIYMKHGYGTSTERSDTGFVDQTHTGFLAGTNGVYYHLNWISIGW